MIIGASTIFFHKFVGVCHICNKEMNTGHSLYGNPQLLIHVDCMNIKPIKTKYKNIW